MYANISVFFKLINLYIPLNCLFEIVNLFPLFKFNIDKLFIERDIQNKSIILYIQMSLYMFPPFLAFRYRQTWHTTPTSAV